MNTLQKAYILPLHCTQSCSIFGIKQQFYGFSNYVHYGGSQIQNVGSEMQQYCILCKQLMSRRYSFIGIAAVQFEQRIRCCKRKEPMWIAESHKIIQVTFCVAKLDVRCSCGQIFYGMLLSENIVSNTIYQPLGFCISTKGHFIFKLGVKHSRMDFDCFPKEFLSSAIVLVNWAT